MIVTVTRGDLRDEFSMADEAFALSPISARATLPSEADYDAISEAFMETSRGRWFLNEYAKRNRNADTRMVLDAVARIEANLATQNNVAPDNGLAEALAAISSAIVDAKTAASEAFDGAAIAESLGPIRNGARVIRETLSRLREIGADGRIYDVMDSQVSAIEAGCGQLAAADPRAALNAAFDLIEARIKQLDESDTARPPVSEKAPSSPKAAYEEAPPAEAATSEVAAPPSETAPEPAMEVTAPEEFAATAQSGVETIEPETALDDALDMIALEMAAPDHAEDDVDEFCVAEPEPEQLVISAQVAEAVIALKAQPMPASPEQPSLGASLIANGIVQTPNPSGLDPLAPIRRMSQAEKIAFFS
jgi:hypothetical protein